MTSYCKSTKIKKIFIHWSLSLANLVLLGAYLEASKVVSLETVEAALERRMAGGRREDMLSLNKAALREGTRLMAEHPRPRKKRSLVSGG